MSRVWTVEIDTLDPDPDNEWVDSARGRPEYVPTEAVLTYHSHRNGVEYWLWTLPEV